MAIDKRISAGLIVAPIYDGWSKLAQCTPGDTHIPTEIEQYIDMLKPDPRFAYMHTIAMSDGDSYGSNLNGDVFEWDELTGHQTPDQAAKNIGKFKDTIVPRFKTFETSRFFRRHAHGPHDPFYGDVPLAAINVPMRRIELIIRIARDDVPELGMQGAPDLCGKLDSARPLAVSMGTRIDHEQCTFCHAKNQFVAQRCPHLKFQMGEIMPNGVKIAALNYGMRFFDISDVIIPADPIALSLSKVAAVLAEVASTVPNTATDANPTEYWRRKWAEIVKTIPGDAIGQQTGVLPKAEVPEFADEELKSAMAHGFDAVVSTATALGIVFSPIELAKLSSYAGPTDDIAGFTDLALDNFNYHVYDALRSKVASRSGFLAPLPAADWNPLKIAEAGHREMGEFYAYYRTCISSLPSSLFAKIASVHPAIRTLHENRPERIKDATLYLARAGLD